MNGGPDITIAAGPLLKASWWCMPVGYGYGAASQPIAGKPAPTGAAKSWEGAGANGTPF